MIGGPGTGKTMMASRLPTIMPLLKEEEALEVTKIHSVAGLNIGKGLMAQRPFRAPHHSVSRAGLVGGGSGIPRPGELSLSHRGVLFLDELPEFSRAVLENLRQPIESGEVILSRVMATLVYPARTLLVAAMNPCPCGYFGQTQHKCRCLMQEVMRYRNRLSGPLLDRIDIQIEVPPVPLSLLQQKSTAEPSVNIRDRVVKARECQEKRFGSGRLNAQMGRKDLETWAWPDCQTAEWLHQAGSKMGLSARSHDRVLRVARTIADLAQEEKIQLGHVQEAVQYRNIEKNSDFPG
jgi:magnesium chelatase family protein